MFDIDNFKSINDTYGHNVGDNVLQNIVQVATRRLRKDDLIARLGGEEFVIFLENTPLVAAQSIAEDIRLAISNTSLVIDSNKISITATFGVSSFQNSDEDFEEVFKKADFAMYEGKADGRNKVKVSSN